MAALLVELDADLVALQEVAHASIEGRPVDQAAEFGHLTGLDHRYGAVWHFALIEPETAAASGATLWGNAILSRQRVSAVTTDALPVVENDDPAHPQDVEPRCALSADIELSVGRLRLVSTHFGWFGSRARRAQAERTAELVGGAPGPLVLAGDLNAPIEAPELAPLRGLTDAFTAVGVPPGDERRQSCDIDRIDHLLVRGIEVLECRVVSEAGDLSDHLPVLARLRLLSDVGISHN
jgi:endonuclease/exonuclease/phosphatase family metal-dependent hydrolase